jgi:ribosomal protein S18 acetylase RimI-like enzyme
MNPEITLKPEQPDDDAFLFELYSATRAAEMALTPWNDEQRRAFLRQQYELRRFHYLRYHSGAEYLLIRRDGHPIGRIAIHRREDEIRIMDIALVPEHRGSGIGSQLIHELLTEASAQNTAVTLHVERHNRAAALYQRLGFRVVEDGGVYLFLKWVPESHLQPSLNTTTNRRFHAI